MNNIRIIIGLLLVIGLLFTLGCLTSKQDFYSALKKIDTVEQAVTSLKSDLASTQKEINTIKSQLETDKSSLADTRQELGGVQDQLEIEKNELGKIRSQVSGLKVEIIDLENQVNITTPTPTPAGALTPLIQYDLEDNFTNTGFTVDKMKSGPDLKIIGDVRQSTGINRKCASFSSNGYFKANNNPTADFTTFTVALWFRSPTPQNNYKPAAAAWWHGGLDASGWTMATHCPEAWADNQQELFDNGRHCTRNISFTQNSWIHMVITHDGKYFREYINGEMSFEDTTIPDVKIGRGDALTVGAWMGGFLFNGEIDEVMIFNKILQPDEVYALCLENAG